MCLATYKIFNTQKWKLGQDINSILSGQSSGVLEENPRIIVSTGVCRIARYHFMSVEEIHTAVEQTEPTPRRRRLGLIWYK